MIELQSASVDTVVIASTSYKDTCRKQTQNAWSNGQRFTLADAHEKPLCNQIYYNTSASVKHTHAQMDTAVYKLRHITELKQQT